MIDSKLLRDRPLLCEPAAVEQYLERLERIPTCPSVRELAEYRRERLEEARQAAARAIRATRGKVGVIGVHGPVEQRMSSALRKLGGTSCEEVGVALDALLADGSVEAIVLHIDSPGGSVYGVEELSDKIYAARGRKKIYAVADSMAASAAYWIASAAETVICTPGGDVGSVGVYCVHVDESKALEAEGIKVTLVKAGKYKAEMASISPLGEEARTHLQQMVDETYGKFTGALKRNRGVSLDAVRRDFGEGRLVSAQSALAAKMIDRVMSFDQFIARLTGGAEQGRQASVEVLRLRLAHQRRKEAE